MKTKRILSVSCLFLSTLLLLIACQQPSEAQLRERYPLYQPASNGFSAYAPFIDRVKGIDTAVYATLIEDVQKLSVSNSESPVKDPDPDFLEKFPIIPSFPYYVLYLHVDTVIYGNVDDKDLMICLPASCLENSVQPNKGDSFFFFLAKGKVNKTIERLIDENKSAKKLPIYAGGPIFYKTSNDLILTIVDRDDQKEYDMKTSTEFIELVRKLKDKASAK